MEIADTRFQFLEELTSNDVISSFIYASAVNVVLANGVLKTDLSIFIALGTILFLFIDWLSRVTIPISFPEEDQAKRKQIRVKISKAILEILLIFTLVSTCMQYINPPQSQDIMISGYKTFAIFLFISFCWNLLMLYVMQSVSFKDLGRSILLGNAYDIKGARSYTQRFNLAIESAEQKLIGSTSVGQATANFNKLKKQYLLEGFVRTIGQLVANHFTWINIFLGIILFFELSVDHNFLGHFIFLEITFNFYYFLVPTLLFISIFIFYKICYVTKKKDKNLDNLCPTHIKIFRSIAAICVLLFFMLFYLTLNHTAIIVIMLIQQTIVGLFLRYAVPKKIESPKSIKLSETIEK